MSYRNTLIGLILIYVVMTTELEANEKYFEKYVDTSKTRDILAA